MVWGVVAALDGGFEGWTLELVRARVLSLPN
jgi:hypothetical protein